MDGKTATSLLKHLDKGWRLVAITPDEVQELRALGLVEKRTLDLTPAGRERLAA